MIFSRMIKQNLFAHPKRYDIAAQGRSTESTACPVQIIIWRIKDGEPCCSLSPVPPARKKNKFQ